MSLRMVALRLVQRAIKSILPRSDGKLKSWGHKTFHIFHLHVVTSVMISEISNLFVNIQYIFQRKTMPDMTVILVNYHI